MNIDDFMFFWERNLKTSNAFSILLIRYLSRIHFLKVGSVSWLRRVSWWTRWIIFRAESRSTLSCRACAPASRPPARSASSTRCVVWRWRWREPSGAWWSLAIVSCWNPRRRSTGSKWLPNIPSSWRWECSPSIRSSRTKRMCAWRARLVENTFWGWRITFAACLVDHFQF